MEILKGHTSPETAYLVRDYPYGYTLRCQIRYWLEHKPGKGVRFVSQTTNPKRPGIVWNGEKWVGDVPDIKPDSPPGEFGPFIMNAEGVGRLGDGLLDHGVTGEAVQHADRLRALAGEQECEFAHLVIPRFEA